MRERRTPSGQRVLDTAARLFYRTGINTVGVELIAATAGVTKKTLYDCFGSKTNLVVAYLEQRDQRWWSYLEQRLAETHAADGVGVVVHAYLEHPDLETDRGCAFLNAAAELPADHPGAEVIRRHKAHLLDRLEALLTETVPVSNEPPRELAEQVFLVLEGLVVHQKAAGTKLDSAAQRAIAQLVSSSSTPASR